MACGTSADYGTCTNIESLLRRFVLLCVNTPMDRRLDVAQTSSEYVLQQRHLLCYESEPIS